MRDCLILINNDNTVEISHTNQYVGEHAATRLVITLNDELCAEDISYYTLSFEVGCETTNPYKIKIRTDSVADIPECAHFENGIIYFTLPDSLTLFSTLNIQVEAHTVDENENIIKTVKSTMFEIHFNKSVEGEDYCTCHKKTADSLHHAHGNKKTIDEFYCEALETGFQQDASSTDLKWNGASLRFANEGAVVDRVEPTVNEEGKNVFRLWLNWGNSQYVINKDYVDIPVESVKDTVIEGGDIVLNGAELQFTMGGGGSGLTKEQAADLAANTEARHTHENKDTLDRFGNLPQTEYPFPSENDTPTYNGTGLWTTEHGQVIADVSKDNETGDLTFELRKYPQLDEETNTVHIKQHFKTSELENDSGFITADDMPESGSSADLTNRFTTTAENEEPIYGEELATADGWTADGWSGDFSSGFTNTTNNTTPLIFAMPENTAQNTYRISFRCSTSIAVEALMVKCGNSELFDLYGQPNNPVILGITSVENGNLEFVPASTFKGTITDISIKRVIGFNPTTQTITDSTGEISCEMRTTKASLENLFIGKHSGEDNISGTGCVAVGSSALQNNTSGFWNVGVGHNALRDNTVGSRNVGIGYIALAENITGTRNIAIGSFALNHNKTGNKNIAIGADCLDKNETGSENVAIGLQALYHNVSGSKNTAIGTQALLSSTGNNNTAVGYGALQKCTTGNGNIAMGYCSGYGITTGSDNFALGANALYKLKTGGNNIGIGVQAGRGQGTTTGFKCGIFLGTQTGYSLCDNADYNILIGYQAGYNITTGSNNIVIGEKLDTPTPTTSNWVNIGGLYEGSRNTADKYAKINGGLQLSDIPTSDPAIAGRVWNDNGTLKVSAG